MLSLCPSVLFCFTPLLNLSPGLGVAVAALGLGTGACFKVATVTAMAAFKNGPGCYLMPAGQGLQGGLVSDPK